MTDARNWFEPVPEPRKRRLPGLRRQGRAIERNGRRLIDFASNDYLGLAAHEAVKQAAADTIRQQGLGSGASRLVSGDDPELHALERTLAEWKRAEAALVLGSGMLANLGLIQAVAGRHDTIFADRLNHASLIDGARLSGARLRRYPHRDLEALERMLARAEGSGRRIIVSDGVFSMDGDRADVAGLIRLAEEYDALLILDDAHGLGVLGPEGAGLVREAGLSGHPRLVEVGTFGKALGGYGAFIAAPKAFIEGLVNRQRTLIYSTALPPAVAAGVRAAVALAREGALRAKLAENIARFRRAAEGLPLLDSATPIQPLILGSDERALEASRRLAEAGWFVPAIRPPTVPEGSARLRITLSAAHTPAEIDGFAADLRRILRQLR